MSSNNTSQTIVKRPSEQGEVPTQITEPQEVKMRKWMRNADGSIDPEYDMDLGGKTSNVVDNTAHDTAATLVSAVPTGRELYLKCLTITNQEAYRVLVEIYDDTTVIYEVIVPATASLGLSKDDLIGIVAATDLTFRTQVLGGEAWSAGTSVCAGYFLKET